VLGASCPSLASWAHAPWAPAQRRDEDYWPEAAEEPTPPGAQRPRLWLPEREDIPCQGTHGRRST
jgi:hypothetical protein